MGVTLEQLQEVMDAYADLRYRIDGRKSEMETAIDKVLAEFPEVRLRVEQIKEDFEGDMEESKQQEKSQRKVLDSMVQSYLRDNPVGLKDVISSKMLTITATAKPKYDVVELDGYALSNPQILEFRDEEVKTVVRLKSL